MFSPPSQRGGVGEFGKNILWRSEGEGVGYRATGRAEGVSEMNFLDKKLKETCMAQVTASWWFRCWCSWCCWPTSWTTRSRSPTLPPPPPSSSPSSPFSSLPLVPEEVSLEFFTPCSSVADPNPDPPDPHVFGPPGSGSTTASQRYGSGSGSCSGSFYHHAKIVRKTWIPTILWLFLTFYLWKMM